MVTSLFYTGNLAANVPSASDGLAAADALCTEVADGRQLNGTWRAFLSTGTVTAPNRMIGAGPWFNLADGGVVFANRAAMTLGLISTGGVISIDDGGVTTGSRLFWSGTSSTGAASGAHCQNWSVSTGTGTIGATVPNSVTWNDSQEACANLRRLLCMEQDVAPLRLSPRPTSPRRLFLTSLQVNANLGGAAGADSLCTNVANARGISGQWVALLSGISTERPVDRASSEGPFTSLDGGVLFVNRAALSSGFARSLGITTEQGLAPASTTFWSGSAERGAPGLNCANWTALSGSGLVGDALSWGSGSLPCSQVARVLCVER